MYLPRHLLCPHEIFQQRCEANSAYYIKQHQKQQQQQATCNACDGSASRLSDHSIVSPVMCGGHESPTTSLVMNAPRRIGRILPTKSCDIVEPLSVFHSKVLPQISLFELSCTMNRATNCGESLLLMTLVLASRYCTTTKTRPTALMMHRLYVACLLVAIKAHSDEYLDNAAFAHVCGVTLTELNRLECEIVSALDWHLQVTREEVDALLANNAERVSPAPAPSAPLKPQNDASFVSELFLLPMARRQLSATESSTVVGSFGASQTVSPSASSNMGISLGCSSSDASKAPSSCLLSPQCTESRSSPSVAMVDGSPDLVMACRLSYSG